MDLLDGPEHTGVKDDNKTKSPGSLSYHASFKKKSDTFIKHKIDF